MSPVLVLLLLSLRTADLRHLHTDPELETQRAEGARAAGTEESLPAEGTSGARVDAPRVPGLKRAVRGAAEQGSSRRRDPLSAGGHGQPRRYDDPSGYFTTPRVARVTSAPAGNSSSGRGSGPLFPATDGAYWAYAVMLLALVLFAAGIVGNLALMCIVWHDFYLKSAWNCVLAGMAFWDFLVLFFCLPVVVFHELTLKRLLGDLSCRLVPYLEVTSLGVATFSLCALSIDRFHAATGPGPLRTPKVEPCRSILSKLCVIWTGSMVLAAPELLLWQLLQETVSLPGSLMAAFGARTDAFKVDSCVREPWADLPEGVYSLVLTYHEARTWWFFGCYICLPLLFTLACDLVTRQVLAQRPPQNPGVRKASGRYSSSSSSSTTTTTTASSSSSAKKPGREQRLRSTVMALALLYVTCNLPESVWSIALTYAPGPAAAAALPALGLVGQFLLFARCAATPALLLCLCRTLGQAFADCCCCCCDECLPDGTSASSAAAAAASSSSALSSPSPSSLAPSSKEETLKSGTEAAAAARDRARDCPAAIGTPC